MLRKSINFFNLSFRKQYLFLLALLLSICSYLMMRFFNKYAKFRQSNTHNKTCDKQLIADIRWAIKAVNKYTIWENVCRHQAYQAMLLCKIFKIQYQIFIGFKTETDEQNHKKTVGHAWALANGEMVSGFCNPEEFIIHQIY